jgi:hypothetical protein
LKYNYEEVSGTKNSITHRNRGTCLDIVSGPVTVKYQLKHSGDVFRKYRSDKVSALGEINNNNRGVFELEKRR